MWFPDQNSKSIQVEDKTNITLLFKSSVKHKKWSTIQFNLKIDSLVKRYGFLSSAKNIGKCIGKNISKNLSCKHSQKIFDHAKESTTDAIKTAFKRLIQNTTEVVGDLIGNKFVYKINQKVHCRIIQNEHDKEIPKERYASPEERQNIIDELRSI